MIFLSNDIDFFKKFYKLGHGRDFRLVPEGAWQAGLARARRGEYGGKKKSLLVNEAGSSYGWLVVGQV